MSSETRMPDLPVDDASLDLYWSALHPEVEAERSSIGDVLDLLSEMSGSDPRAVVEEVDGVAVMRDPMYHPNDLLSALIVEVRRLRSCGGSETRRLAAAVARVDVVNDCDEPDTIDLYDAFSNLWATASEIVAGCESERRGLVVGSGGADETRHDRYEGGDVHTDSCRSFDCPCYAAGRAAGSESPAEPPREAPVAAAPAPSDEATRIRPVGSTATAYHHSEGDYGILHTDGGCWLTCKGARLANFYGVSMAAEYAAKAMNEHERLAAAEGGTERGTTDG